MRASSQVQRVDAMSVVEILEPQLRRYAHPTWDRSPRLLIAGATENGQMRCCRDFFLPDRWTDLKYGSTSEDDDDRSGRRLQIHASQDAMCSRPTQTGAANHSRLKSSAAMMMLFIRYAR